MAETVLNWMCICGVVNPVDQPQCKSCLRNKETVESGKPALMRFFNIQDESKLPMLVASLDAGAKENWYAQRGPGQNPISQSKDVSSMNREQIQAEMDRTEAEIQRARAELAQLEGKQSATDCFKAALQTMRERSGSLADLQLEARQIAQERDRLQAVKEITLEAQMKQTPDRCFTAVFKMLRAGVKS